MLTAIEQGRGTGADLTFADVVTLLTASRATFDQVGRACITLEQLAADRGIELDLLCADADA